MAKKPVRSEIVKLRFTAEDKQRLERMALLKETTFSDLCRSYVLYQLKADEVTRSLVSALSEHDVESIQTTIYDFLGATMKQAGGGKPE